MTFMPRHLLQAFVATSCALVCGLATAQAYPSKPISLVVPFAAGGPTDIVARTLAASMSKSLGQTVLVENKVGAGGTLAAAYVAKANPDGYTFLIHHNGMSTAPALYRKMTFNPLTDFEYVSQVVDQKGVTVRVGLGHIACRQRATRTDLVFDQHGLPQGLAHAGGQRARHDVGGTTGRKRHHQADGLVRVGLRGGQSTDQGAAGGHKSLEEVSGHECHGGASCCNGMS